MRQQLKKVIPRSFLLLAMLMALAASLPITRGDKPNCVCTNPSYGLCVRDEGQCVASFCNTNSCKDLMK